MITSAYHGATTVSLKIILGLQPTANFPREEVIKSAVRLHINGQRTEDSRYKMKKIMDKLISIAHCLNAGRYRCLRVISSRQ